MTRSNSITVIPVFYVPDEPVTWAGAGRRPNEIAMTFGSGRLQFFDTFLNPVSPRSPVLRADTSFNGAAFDEGLIVLGVRDEVLVYMGVDGKPGEFTIGSGCHGVVGGVSGKVVAPMGDGGLLCIRKQENGNYRRSVVKVEGAEPYFYRTVCLGKDEAGYDLFASACRSDGLVLTPIGPHHALGEISFLEAKRDLEDAPDIVSLCPLKLPDYPRALALLAMDGSIYFSSDPRSGEFVAMASDRLQGTPYSIHSAQGHLFILTSDKMYALRNLGRNVIRDEPIAIESNTVSFEVDAVDSTLIDDEYLLIVREELVTLNRVSEMFGPSQVIASNYHSRQDSTEARFTESMFQPRRRRSFESFSEFEAVERVFGGESDSVATMLEIG